MVKGWYCPERGAVTSHLPPFWCKIESVQHCELMPPPDDWDPILPAGTLPRDVWGFDRNVGKPKDWPLLFSMAAGTPCETIVSDKGLI